MNKLTTIVLLLISTAAIANTDYENAVNAYIEYNCDYNAKAIIKDGAKDTYAELIIACRKGAEDISKFISEWPDFGTNDGIIAFQDTVDPYARENKENNIFKSQIYQYGVGSWGIAYLQSARAKANTVTQWKNGDFKVKK